MKIITKTESVAGVYFFYTRSSSRAKTLKEIRKKARYHDSNKSKERSREVNQIQKERCNDEPLLKSLKTEEGGSIDTGRWFQK